MTGDPQETQPSDRDGEIPPEIEAQILDILDRTEPGAERAAALAGLTLTEDQRKSVQSWLADDATETTDFLRSPPTVAPTTTDSAGLPRRLGEYELESVLGRGGMGIVYRARDLRLGRIVALKVLPERFADNPKRKLRFEREIKAVAGLNHPAIVPVFAAAQIGEVPFFTMEYVTGQSLDKVIRSLAAEDKPVGALRLNDWLQAVDAGGDASASDNQERTYLEAVCHLLIQIAGALQHAHERGVTHRDVKPSNVITDGHGQARLLDFGLASIDADLAMTRSSEVIGSPHYMSPEQISSDSIDHRTDIYSLGVTMYELLTLQVPFDAQTPQQAYHEILTRDPRRPRQLNPQLPADLETICLTAMEKDPERRYESATAFAEDLRHFLRFEPIQARPIGSVTRSVRWLRRNRTPVSIVALLMIAAIAIFVTNRTRRQVRTITTERDQIQSDLERLERERRVATATLEKLKTQASETSASLTDKQRELEAIDTELRKQKAAREELEGIRAALVGQNADLQAATAKQSAELAGLREKEKTLTQAQSRLSESLQQGRRDLDQALARQRRAQADYARLDLDFRITTINKLLMEARTLRGSDSGLGLTLAHEAARLANRTQIPVALESEVDDTLLDLLRTTQEQRTFRGHTDPITAIDFDPSGSRLVSTSIRGVARIWERETGREVSNLRDRSLVHAEFVATDWLLLAREDGTLLSWDGSPESAPRSLLGGVHQRGLRRHVDPSGQFVVSHASALPGPLVVHGRGGRNPVRHLGTTDNPIAGFEFDPVSERLLAITTNRDLEVWGLREGTRQLRISIPAPVLSATFDSEGRRIACLDARGVLRVYHATDAAVLLEHPINQGKPLGAGRLAFCADNRRLLVTAIGMDGHLLVDPRTGEIRATVPAHPEHREFRLGPQLAMACFPDPAGGHLLIQTLNGRVLARLREQDRESTTGRRPAIAFSPDRQAVATIHGDRLARIWSTSPGGGLVTVGPLTADASGLERLRFGHFAPGAQRVVTVSNLGLSSWHLRSGSRHLLPQDPRRPLTPEALTADGGGVAYLDGAIRELVAGPRPANRVLRQVPAAEVDQVVGWPGGGAAAVLAGTSREAPRRLWLLDAEGSLQRPVLDLPPGRAGGGTPIPSPDGTRFVIGYDALTLITLADPSKPLRLQTTRRPLAFSPDSQKLAASTGFAIRLFDVRTGAVRCEFGELPRNGSELTGMAFSPGGDRVATAWSDGRLRVYDISRPDPRTVFEVRGHSGPVRSVAFSHDGVRILTASDDGTARIWNCRGETRARLTFSPGEPCVHAEFSADDETVLCLCPRSVHTFPVDPRPLAARVCPRRLTAAERDHFGVPDPPR